MTRLWALVPSRAKIWGAVAAFAGVALVVFGATQRKAGADKVRARLAERDRHEANAIRDRVRAAKRVQPTQLRYRD